MIGGLVKGELFLPENILCFDPSDVARAQVGEEYGVNIQDSNVAVATQADYLVLAVKPFVW